MELYCYEGAYFLKQLAYIEAKLEMNEIIKYWWRSGVAYTAQVTQIFDNGDVQLRVPPKPQQKWVKAHTSPRKVDPVRVIVRKSEIQSRIFRPPPNRGAWDELICKDLRVPLQDVRYLGDRLRRTSGQAAAACILRADLYSSCPSSQPQRWTEEATAAAAVALTIPHPQQHMMKAPKLF
jgi:hypothetical protein